MEFFTEKILPWLPYIYLAAISLISVIVTCYDKIAAKKFPRHRTPEARLLSLSLIGGSVAMLITMKLIRHKTKHKKFMIGIPLIIIFQIALAVCVWYFLIR